MPSLDDADLEAIRAVVRTEQAIATVTDQIFTRDEAITYTKHNSPSAFYRWLRLYRVPGRNDRYSRQQLDAGLSREAQRGRRRGPCRSETRRVAVAA